MSGGETTPAGQMALMLAGKIMAIAYRHGWSFEGTVHSDPGGVPDPKEWADLVRSSEAIWKACARSS